MVTKQGNLNIYDNFKMGVIARPTEPGADQFVHATFTEQDFEQDELNTSHIFKIHVDQIDAYIELLRGAQQKKHIHVPKPGEAPV